MRQNTICHGSTLPAPGRSTAKIRAFPQQELRVPRDLKVKLDHRAFKVKKVNRARRVLRVKKVNRVRRDLKVLRVLKASRAYRAYRVKEDLLSPLMPQALLLN